MVRRRFSVVAVALLVFVIIIKFGPSGYLGGSPEREKRVLAKKAISHDDFLQLGEAKVQQQRSWKAAMQISAMVARSGKRNAREMASTSGG